jgi:hypothetical protein
MRNILVSVLLDNLHKQQAQLSSYSSTKYRRLNMKLKVRELIYIWL